jgi:hypothetical protein
MQRFVDLRVSEVYRNFTLWYVRHVELISTSVWVACGLVVLFGTKLYFDIFERELQP